LAPTKYWRQQNIGIDKILALTKYWRQQNIAVNKILLSTESTCRQKVGACVEASPYCFGLAESATADFSQALLMFSYFSLKMLISPHAVTKCAVAAGRPASLGGLSPALYRRVPARHAENVTNMAPTKYRRPPIFHKFLPNYSSHYLCSQVSYQKLVKTKSNHFTVRYQFLY
jgi:hypothetical protein